MTTPAVQLGDFSTFPIPTGKPQQLLPAMKDVQVTLANQDLVNTVYVARTFSFALGGGNTLPIPALGAVTVDASKSLWVLGPANTQPLIVIPGGGNWAPSPAQVAAQINALGLMKDTTGQAINTTAGGTTGAVNTVNGTLGAPAQDSIRTAIPNNISTTGVPLLNLSTVQSSNASLGVSANSSNTVGPFALNQPGFELAITSSFAVAVGATPYAFIVLKWSDPTSGLVIAKDTFVIWTASNAAIKSLPFIIRGPTKAGQVTLSIFNLDAAQNILVTYTLLSDSRVIPAETIQLGLDWKEDSAVIGIFGSAATRVLPDSNVVATFVNSALAAAGTDTWITPPATGLGYLNFQETGVAAANMTVTVQPVPASIYGGIFLVNDIMVAGNPNKLTYANLILPNGPLQVQVHNGGSVNASYNGMLVAEMGT